MKTYSVAIYVEGAYAAVCRQGNFKDRDAAEKLATLKREQLNRNGWSHKVVVETHEPHRIA
jgi:hypothetical protein